MSRKGKVPIIIPAGMQVKMTDAVLSLVHGAKSAQVTIHDSVKLTIEDGQILCRPVDDTKEARSLHGTTQVIVANAVKGLSTPFVIELQLVGIGYSVVLEGEEFVFNLGKSHQDRYKAPEHIEIQVVDKSNLKIIGQDKQQVGAVANEIVRFRVPDSYKNKGVRYKGKTYINKEVKK
jgi:large subunit ribosomal protein L6